MKTIDKKAVKEKVEWVLENKGGVAWFNMGWLEDGRELGLVIGLGEGYDKDDKLIQIEDNGVLYTVCSKLAVNIDDLQCDYDWDWYMPWDKDGNIWDTDTAVKKDYDLDWYIEESKAMLEAFNKGEIVCDTRK